MKSNKLKLLLSIPAVAACILFGCEKRETVSLTELRSEQEASGDIALDKADENDPSEEREETLPPEEEKLVVHICGAVVNPGVYELPKGSRIYQAVEAAGGFSGEAFGDSLNQAEYLQDGSRIYVPTVEEAADYAAESSTADSGLVNINTASETELCTLSGIGSSKAESIIKYRTENGNFSTIEDIMKVEGIKDGLFQKIKDSITV